MSIYCLSNADWENQRVIFASLDKSKVESLKFKLDSADIHHLYPTLIKEIREEDYYTILKSEISKRGDWLWNWLELNLDVLKTKILR